MGVTGLWDVLRPAAISRSFTAVSVDGFTQNASTRGFRVGIDASIWFVHATYGQEGENPELRTIFFRLTRLLKLPFLPVFVFDGPMRPDVKRGKMIDKKPHWMVEGMKRMVEAFGFEWRTAPGEAEAELAYLNRIGVVDAVLSDDVDTLVFGATMVIRNPSETLSGNRAHTQATKNHTMTFSAENIASHPEVSLSYKDLVLVALLSGGDYHNGVEGCGMSAAVGIARAGFGESLVAKVKSLALSVQHAENKRTRVTLHGRQKQELEAFLQVWRTEVAEELRTNSRKFLSRKNTRAANNLLAMGAAFPDIDVLMAYINPVTSEERAVAKAVKANPNASGTALTTIVNRARGDVAHQLRETITWPRDPSVGAIAKICEDYFEWGYKERMIYRFRSWLWEGIICRTLRRKTIIIDSSNRGAIGNGEETLETASQPLVMKISSSRTHATTDNLLEYRLEIDPRLLVRVAENGIEGRRSAPTTGWSDEDEDDGGEEKTKGKSVDPNTPGRYWMPACMVEKGEPELAQAFEEAQRVKAAKKAAQGTARARTKTKNATTAATKSKLKSKSKASRNNSDSEGEFSASPLSTPNITPRKPKTARPAAEHDIIRPAAPRGTVNNFFAASKTSIPNDLRSQKIPVSNVPSTSRVQNPPAVKAKAKDSRSTSISRVAALFDGEDVRVFKDLTKAKGKGITKDGPRPKYLQPKDSGFSSATTTTPPSGNVPTQDISLDRNAPSSSNSPMRSTTNLLPHTFASEVPEPLLPEAGPSEPSGYFFNAARSSTWKPTPFPMDGLDIPPRFDSPPPSGPLVFDPTSPSRRRSRRTSSPIPSAAGPSVDQLQKSPRKSKKQVSPRSSSASPTRRGLDDDDAPDLATTLQLLPAKKTIARAPRRAVMKDRAKHPTGNIVEISSDSDSPPPAKQKPLHSMLKVKKRVAVAREEKASKLPPLPAFVEVIDLCSD